MNDQFEKVVRKWALYNAIKYGGKAQLGAVISKVVYELPEIKSNIKEYIPIIKKITEEVNSLSMNDQKKELEILAPELLDKKPKGHRTELPELPNAEEGRVVTRFAPNPNGYLHIGHARAIVINYEYSRKYRGKFILRLEDTDPKVKKPLLDAYRKIPEDIEWLIEDRPDEFYIQSERLEIYYRFAEELIRQGKAYVDLSPPEKVREYRLKGIPTEYREKDPEWNMEQWTKMLNGEFDEGQATLRIKTDLSHPNPSVRDWIAFRIVNPEKNPHPWLEYRFGDDYAKKYWVWPTYNFANAIDDYLMGITHIFRMKEHEVNTLKQKYIYDYFGWKSPTVMNYGAVIVKDAPFHKSEIKKLIEEGKVSGWDDPFLPTLMGLRRRGIHPRAIRKYMIELGPGKVDVVLSWEKLYSYNREIYDKSAKRYFFIENPVEIKVEGLKEMKISVKNHPEVDLGKREFYIKSNVIFLDKNDLKYKYLRLMEGFNIEIIDIGGKVSAKYIDDSLETAKRLGAKIVQWVPKGYEEIITVWRPERKIKGIGEKYILDAREDEIVHFVRYGFLKRERDVFIWMHK